MVRITEQAGALLQRMQSESSFPNTLRVTTESDSLVIGTSAPAEDDEVVLHDGVPVLRVSAGAAQALDGCTIASKGTPDQADLTIFGPGEAVEEPQA